MLCTNLIKALALALFGLTLSSKAAFAGGLTKKEQTVCASLKACIDIVRRHDASEFDYDVLEVEFRQFGEAGKSALFSVLEDKDGHADIARIILKSGPLTQSDRQRIQTKWSLAKAPSYLPLLLDGHPMSRDFLLLSLGHADAAIREKARRALIELPPPPRAMPLPQTLRSPLLEALIKDPIGQAAPYLERLNAAGHENQYSALLASGEPDIVSAAYTALYRNSPSRAFNALMSEMEKFEEAAQSRAVGKMLAARHSQRKDGFYLKFASDMSGDAKLSVPARAAGLHAVLSISESPFPEFTSSRREALSFLTEGQLVWAQDQYLSVLKAKNAEEPMSHIWSIAQKEKWINRDRLAEHFSGHPISESITRDLLSSNDIRSFSAGLSRANSRHEPLIRAQINHPVKLIANAARQKLGLRKFPKSIKPCPFDAFDLNDVRAQMPFFESGWMTSDHKARIALSRSYLTTAHPSKTGWLAGYDLTKPVQRSIHNGGIVLHYDNISGAWEEIGDFQAPVAILPAEPLKLGQSTNKFWIVDAWGGDALDISAYAVDISQTTPQITHVGALPNGVQRFSIAPNGDLLIGFQDNTQAPIRFSKAGQMSPACPVNRPTNRQRAPQ